MRTRTLLSRGIKDENKAWRCLNGGKLTDSTKYNAGKRVAEYELKNTRDEQQKTSKEDDRSTVLVS